MIKGLVAILCETQGAQMTRGSREGGATSRRTIATTRAHDGATHQTRQEAQPCRGARHGKPEACRGKDKGGTIATTRAIEESSTGGALLKITILVRIMVGDGGGLAVVVAIEERERG
jgi:hypothetical protein